MTAISIPIERLVYGNEHWRSCRAVHELKVYCDLQDTLQDTLQDRRESLEERGKSDENPIISVQAVISSYAIEIAMKSLWELDNTPKPMPRTHNLLCIFDELAQETVDALRQLQLTKKEFESVPNPFYSNRYSMEAGTRNVSVYSTQLIRSLMQ